MKKLLRTTAIAAFICLSTGLTLSSARADDSTELVRSAQIRLADLGYYVGRADGEMGAVTRDAIMAFQRNDGLAMTGELTPETYSRLSHGDYIAAYPLHYTTAYNNYNYDGRLYGTNYIGSMIVSDANGFWDNGWRFTHTQALPSRFARLDISEDDRSGLRDYVMTVNGRAVLFANNQPYLLRVSQTFAVNSFEDAVIITARQGEGSCTYKNYLLTVHRDGSFNLPREVGNCASAYEAHVADGALVLSFPGTNLAYGLDTWDTWRYENNALNRL